MFNLSTAVARASSNQMWSQILSAVPRETHGQVGVSISFMLAKTKTDNRRRGAFEIISDCSDRIYLSSRTREKENNQYRFCIVIRLKCELNSRFI